MAGIPAVRAAVDTSVLLGGRHLAGQFLYVIADALYKSLGVLFLIFLGRMLLRKQWLAAGVIVVSLAGINAANAISPFIGWPVNIAFFGVVVFTLMRFGLLSMSIALFMSLFIGQFPLTADWSVWYSGEIAQDCFRCLIALCTMGSARNDPTDSASNPKLTPSQKCPSTLAGSL